MRVPSRNWKIWFVFCLMTKVFEMKIYSKKLSQIAGDYEFISDRRHKYYSGKKCLESLFWV